MKKTFLALLMIFVILMGASAYEMEEPYSEGGKRYYEAPVHGLGWGTMNVTSRNEALVLLIEDYEEILTDLGLSGDEISNVEDCLFKSMMDYAPVGYDLYEVFSLESWLMAEDDEGNMTLEFRLWSVPLKMLQDAVEDAIVESGRFKAKVAAENHMDESFDNYFGKGKRDLSSNVDWVMMKWFPEEAYKSVPSSSSSLF